MKQQALFWSSLFLYLLHVTQCIEEHETRPTHQFLGGHHHHQQDNSDQDLNVENDPQNSPDNVEPSQPYPAPSELEFIRLNDTSLVVRWELNTNQKLQYFKIQYKSTNNRREPVGWKTENREIPSTARAYQINGLRPGSYFFIVIAVYDNDDNSPSEQVKFRLRARTKIASDELPEMKAPEVHWSTAQDDYIRFKWKYEVKEKDIPYYGYLVYYRSAHLVTDFTIYNTYDENIEIVHVEPDTPYEAKIVAYNNVTTSEFSEIYRIKTASNSTTSTHASLAPTSPKPTSVIMTSTTTRRPSLEVNVGTASGTTLAPIIVTNSNTTIQKYPPIHSILDSILKQGSLGLEWHVLKYILLVLMPIFFILIASLCLISCHRQRKESPPSSTNESMQFDLEINSYFTNSFPGVEKEYQQPGLTQSAHHGFVNNHPHINDFAY